MNPFHCIADDVKMGQNVKLSKFINLYGCSIGDDTKIGAFVEIQKNASIKMTVVKFFIRFCKYTNKPDNF